MPVRILKTRNFARFARSEHLADKDLRAAIQRAERGLVDADLGGGLIKQRVARPGQGRSRGYRVIIVWRSSDRSICVYGLAKSRRGNIGNADLAELKDLAALLLGYDDEEIDKAVAAGELLEVK